MWLPGCGRCDTRHGPHPSDSARGSHSSAICDAALDWASWTELVFLLDAVDFPTDGAPSVQASGALMPRCAPIGRIFELYELGQSNPAALLIARDLSLARALGEYMATAGNS